MNKKILMFALLGIFAMGLGTAAIVSYFGLFSTTLNVTQPIATQGELSQTINCFAGETCFGDLITVNNVAPFSVGVLITDDSDPEEIITSQISDLELTKKIVVFGEPNWTWVGDRINLEYTLVGGELSVQLTDDPIEGYELIYYKDNSDRFNNPALGIPIDEVEGNLPYETDGNAEEYDYCAMGEYATCHGAKIWYIPSIAMDENGVIDWSQADDFYFETKLIQYNSDGEITIYDALDFTPQYDTNPGLESGEYIITTQVSP